MSLEVLVVNSGDNKNQKNVASVLNALKNQEVAGEHELNIVIKNYREAEHYFNLGHSEENHGRPDLIIFSGRAMTDPPSTLDEIIRYYSWINNADVPVLTICGSYQRWLQALGADLIRHKSEKGLIEIELSGYENDYLHQGANSNHVFLRNGHTRFVAENENFPLDIKVLGKSSFGLAIVKHKTLPIYGYQGHPERGFEHMQSYAHSDDARTYSIMVFRNLLNLAHGYKDGTINSTYIKQN